MSSGYCYYRNTTYLSKMLELSVYSHIVMSVPRNICDIDMTYVYSVYRYVTRRGMFVPHH